MGSVQSWNLFKLGLYANFAGRKSHSEVLSAIQELDDKTKVLKISIGTRLSDFRNELLALLNAQSNSGTLSGSSGNDITTKLVAFAEKAENLERQQSFLEGLMLDSMKRRHDMIKEAHRKTLDWVFERPETGFLKWLGSEGTEGSIYWVTGKVSVYNR